MLGALRHYHSSLRRATLPRLGPRYHNSACPKVAQCGLGRSHKKDPTGLSLFPPRWMIQIGSRRQGFASPLRALDCSGPIRGATLFTRGKRGFGPWGARAGRRTTGAEIARALKTMDY